MRDLVAQLRRWSDAPVHFWVLAAASAALVLLTGATTPVGFRTNYDESVVAPSRRSL